MSQTQSSRRVCDMLVSQVAQSRQQTNRHFKRGLEWNDSVTRSRWYVFRRRIHPMEFPTVMCSVFPFCACLPSTSKDIPLPEVISWVIAVTVCLTTALHFRGLRNSSVVYNISVQFELSSNQVSLRSQKFIVKYRLSDNLYCKYA